MCSSDLFLNETSSSNHGVVLQLIGDKSNRGAIGARVTVVTPDMTQVNEVRGGGSYNSTNDTRLHFGLGTAAIMTTVQVRWPSGLKQEFANVPSDAIYQITEGQSLMMLRKFAGKTTSKTAQ